MTAQKKGPAEGATSPSHGSTNSVEGKVVNDEKHSTASAGSKPDRIDMEGAVNDAARCASIACTLMEGALRPSGVHQQPNGYKVVMLSQEEFDDLHFIVGESAFRAKKAVEAFYARAS